MLTEEELELSDGVANCRMNRERELRGSNGYGVELGIEPVEWLLNHGSDPWLDVCCGTGRALVQAADELEPAGVHITGIDLVSFYWPKAKTTPGLCLATVPVRAFEPTVSYGLITCVHGLHYVGDKLGTLIRLASWLSPAGLLLAHMDLNDVYINGESEPDTLRVMLREAGFTWNERLGLLRAQQGVGPLNLHYVGAVPGGPNRTGQPSTKSHYQTDSRTKEPFNRTVS